MTLKDIKRTIKYDFYLHIMHQCILNHIIWSHSNVSKHNRNIMIYVSFRTQNNQNEYILGLFYVTLSQIRLVYEKKNKCFAMFGR